MKLVLTVVAFAAALSLAAGAQAQMRSPDANNDGVVTKAEHSAASEARFKRMDMNHDGTIDAGELAKVKAFIGQRAPKMAAAMDRMDTDHDGKISHAEFMAASDFRFGKMDANGDGKIDKAEMDAAKAAMGGQ